MSTDELSSGGPLRGAPEASPTAMREQRALVAALAAGTGLRIAEEELDQVAAVFDEYLQHIGALDAVDLELEAGAPTGLDLLRWLGALRNDSPDPAG